MKKILAMSLTFAHGCMHASRKFFIHLIFHFSLTQPFILSLKANLTHAGKCDSYTRTLQMNPPYDWLKMGWVRDSQTRKRLVNTLSCITCSPENNAISVLHYVIKVTLHFLTLPYVTSRRDSLCLGIFALALFSPAVIDQKKFELFKLVIQAWNFHRFLRALRELFSDVGLSQTKL